MFNHDYTDVTKIRIVLCLLNDYRTCNLQILLIPQNQYIYTAETYAIHEVVKINISSILHTVIIISDCFTVLISISNPYSKNELVHHIQENN